MILGILGLLRIHRSLLLGIIQLAPEFHNYAGIGSYAGGLVLKYIAL